MSIELLGMGRVFKIISCKAKNCSVLDVASTQRGRKFELVVGKLSGCRCIPGLLQFSY